MTYLPRTQKAYSAALTNEQKKITDERAGISAAEEFRLIREQLIRQKDWLSKKGTF